MQVVVYFRTRPAEPEASHAALEAQREAVATWLDEHGASAVAEFVEEEAGTKARPQLGLALTASRQHDTAMLVAMTDPIGSGTSFGPFFGDISGRRCFAITHAPPPPQPTPEPPPPIEEAQPAPLPLPDDVPSKLSLLFQPSQQGRLPVLLCNPGPEPLREVVVMSVGTTTKWTMGVSLDGDQGHETQVPLQTSTSRRNFNAIEPRTAILIDRYDVSFDADFVTTYEVTHTDGEGIRQRSRAIVGTGGPTSRWMILDPLPGAGAPSR